MPRRGRFERIRDEAGFALGLALATVVALGAAVGSVTLYVASDVRAPMHDTADGDALALAEAGLRMAHSRLEHSSSPACASAVSATPVADTPLPGGFATFYGSFDASTNVWTLTGVGKAVEPSLHGRVTVRRVQGQASVAAARAPALNCRSLRADRSTAGP
jgi:Tfp pilus assembly protein PilX